MTSELLRETTIVQFEARKAKICPLLGLLSETALDDVVKLLSWLTLRLPSR